MKTDANKYIFQDANKGFTLIEVLVALGIFAIGVLAIASLQLWNVKNNTTGNITTQATMLARTQMETLKNVADVTVLANGNDVVGIYTRTWTITNPLGGNTSRHIQVTVNWNRRGQNRSVVLESITRGNGI